MNYFFLFILTLSHCVHSEQPRQFDTNKDNSEKTLSTISYELNGGRFGDNLLSYARAKWLSYSYNLPFMFYPFPYSDELKLYEHEQMLCMDNFENIVKISKPKDCLQETYNTLYINSWDVRIPINWNDQLFIKELKKMIAPRYDIDTIPLPADHVCIAVHLRKGGEAAVDTPEEKERCPLRFVPDEFFIDQIAELANLFIGYKLYVYIFTDDKNPEILVDKFRKELNNDAITFDCRRTKNSHNTNVLEDFFSMMHFHCLIRPGSHFSRFVERLGQAELVIYPENYKKNKNGTNTINVIGVKNRTNKGWRTTKITIA